MTFRPRRFWHDIDITDTIHISPLLFIPLFLSAILFLLRFGVALWSYSIARIGFVTLNPIAGKFSIKGLFNHWNSYSSWYWHGQVEPVFDVVFFTTLAWSAFILILFRFLPVSLRKCKIRKVHLIRVALYSTIPLLIYLISWAFADVIFLLLHEQLQWPLNNIIDWSYLGLVEFIGVAWYIWQVIFWFFACRHYLKLPHAFWIALLLTSAACLIIILIHVGWWNYQAHQSWSRIPHWQEQLFFNY